MRSLSTVESKMINAGCETCPPYAIQAAFAVAAGCAFLFSNSSTTTKVLVGGTALVGFSALMVHKYNELNSEHIHSPECDHH